MRGVKRPATAPGINRLPLAGKPDRYAEESSDPVKAGSPSTAEGRCTAMQTRQLPMYPRGTSRINREGFIVPREGRIDTLQLDELMAMGFYLHATSGNRGRAMPKGLSVANTLHN